MSVDMQKLVNMKIAKLVKMVYAMNLDRFRMEEDRRAQADKLKVLNADKDTLLRDFTESADTTELIHRQEIEKLGHDHEMALQEMAIQREVAVTTIRGEFTERLSILERGHAAELKQSDGRVRDLQVESEILVKYLCDGFTVRRAEADGIGRSLTDTNAKLRHALSVAEECACEERHRLFLVQGERDDALSRNESSRVALESGIVETSRLRIELGRKDDVIVSLRSEIERADSLLVNATAAVEERGTQLNELTAELMRVRVDIDNKDAWILSLNDQILVDQKACEDLQSELGRTQSVIETLTESAFARQLECDGLRVQLLVSEGEVVQLRQVVAELETKSHALLNDVHSGSLGNAELESERDRLTAELAQKASALVNLQADTLSLTAQVSHLESALAEVHGDRLSLAGDASAVRAELDVVSGSLDMALRDIGAKDLSLAQTESELASLRTSMDGLRRESEAAVVDSQTRLDYLSLRSREEIDECVRNHAIEVKDVAARAELVMQEAIETVEMRAREDIARLTELHIKQLAEKDEWIRNLTQQVEECRATANSLRQDCEAQERVYASRIESQIADADARLADRLIAVRADCEVELAQLQSDHACHLAVVQRQGQETIAQLRTENDRTVSTMRDSQLAEIQCMMDAHNHVCGELETRLRESMADYRIERTRQEEEHRARVDSLVHSLEESEERLWVKNDRIQELERIAISDAGLARDDRIAAEMKISSMAKEHETTLTQVRADHATAINSLETQLSSTMSELDNGSIARDALARELVSVQATLRASLTEKDAELVRSGVEFTRSKKLVEQLQSSLADYVKRVDSLNGVIEARPSRGDDVETIRALTAKMNELNDLNAKLASANEFLKKEVRNRDENYSKIFNNSAPAPKPYKKLP